MVMVMIVALCPERVNVFAKWSCVVKLLIVSEVLVNGHEEPTFSRHASTTVFAKRETSMVSCSYTCNDYRIPIHDGTPLEYPSTSRVCGIVMSVHQIPQKSFNGKRGIMNSRCHDIILKVVGLTRLEPAVSLDASVHSHNFPSHRTIEKRMVSIKFELRDGNGNGISRRSQVMMRQAQHYKKKTAP